MPNEQELPGSNPSPIQQPVPTSSPTSSQPSGYDIPEGLDPGAVNLARAIRQQESGGDYNIVDKEGDSGGAYQWENSTSTLKPGDIPTNFVNDAKQYGLDPTDFSPKNQDMVAYKEIADLKSQGYNVPQIAAIWNGGDPNRMDPNYVTKSGLPSQKKNPDGSYAYNVPGYAQAVNNFYQEYKEQSGQASDPSTSGEAGLPQDNSTSTNEVPQTQTPGSESAQTDNTITPGNGILGKAGAAYAPAAVDAGQGLAEGRNKDLFQHALAQTTIIQRAIENKIATDQAAGKDTTKLEAALQQSIANTPEEQDFTGTTKSAEQVLGDTIATGLNIAGTVDLAGLVPGVSILGSGTEAAAVSASEAATTAAQRIGQGALTGAKYGAGYGLASGMSDDKSLGGVAESTAIGAGTGAIAGGVVSGAIEGGKGLLSSFSTKSADEIAALARDPNVTQKDINKLSPSEQEQYFKEKASSVNEQASTQRTARAAEAQTSIDQANQDIKDFNQKAGEAASSKAESLKEPAQKLMRSQSQTYVQLTQEAASQADENALEKPVKAEDLSNAIDEKFADTDTKDNSGLRASLKSDLGLNPPEEKPQIDEQTGLPVISTEAAPEKTLTNQEILDKAKEIMQTVSKSARGGNTTYSTADYEAMQKYSFLMDQLNENGVDMKAANDFWKNWAPTRDRIVREIKPWDETGVKGSPFAKTLQRAEKTGGTGLQTSAKIDAQKFVSEIESKMGLPKGSLGSEVRDAIQGADQAKVNKDTAAQILSDAKDQIAKDKADALKTMSRQKYDAQAATRKKAIISKIVKYVVGAGAVAAIGDKAVHTFL